MNRALWLLYGMQMRAWLRFLLRNLQTVRGALLALVGVGVFVPWLATALMAPSVSGIDAGQLSQFGPAFLLLYCAANVVFSSHERAIYFSPAEVQFLFPGPFSRREVLAYKVVLTLTVTVPASLLLAALVRVRQGWWPGVLLGLLLISIFMQLFSMVLGLIANVAGEHLYSRGRWFVGVTTVAAAGLVIALAGGQPSAANLPALAEGVLASPAWKTATYPLGAFFAVMEARQLWPDLLVPFGLALSVLLVLVVVLFAVDAHYLEASAAASARLYARIQRMRGKQISVEEPTRPRTAWLEVPTLPYLGGVGPIFWRQLTSALRGMGRFALVLLVIAVSIIGPALGAGLSEPEALVPALGGVGAWLSFFLTTMVPFDFRGDIDRMATLKSLPVVPWRLTVGQLLVPTLLLSLIQLAVVVVCGFVIPEQWVFLVAVAAYIPFYCFMLVALENLLFLLFPVRIMAATPGDFQALGRNVLLALGKVFGLGLVILVAGVVGGLAYFISGEAWVGLAAGWPVVVFFAVAILPLVSLAFQGFDVGRDTPA